MIDTHCHLYVKEFEADIQEVLERAKQAGVNKFYLPAIDSKTHGDMLRLADRYPEACYAMIGLHPCSVNAGYEKELEIIEGLLGERQFAAIGEAGLDFYWDTTFKQQQYKALERQVELALRYALPLVLHTRNAMQETIDFIGQHASSGLKGIFHCFGGTLEQANQVIDLNFLLGIGGVVTYKNSGLDKVLPQIDLKHLVLETDAPYLSPVPHRGKRNESSYLREIASKIAELKNVPVNEVIRCTSENAEGLYKAGI